MNRVVLRVAAELSADPDQQETMFLSLEHPPHDGFQKLHRFIGEPEVLTSFYQDNIRDVGEALLRQLWANPVVKAAFDCALQSTLANECCPVYFDFEGAEQAAEYPWETLYETTNRFLALEGRWPVARIATQTPPEDPVRNFAPPLRIMAVMSAVGVSAAEEWQALRWAIQRSGIQTELELRIWVGEKELQASIERELGALARGSVHLLADSLELLWDIKKFDPHLLHMFCHGEGRTSPLLRLATRRDHQLGDGRGSILLEPLQLRDVGRFPWVVTINACQGGSDAEGARSLAYLLIRGGYPAVVGMRDPVSSVNAAVFCRAFYTSLLSYVDDDVESGDEVELRLAAALVPARRELRDQYPDETPDESAALHRDWTLPILYVRRELVRIKARAAPQLDEVTRKNITDKLDTLGAYLRNPPAGTPRVVLDQIELEIARLEAVLRGEAT